MLGSPLHFDKQFTEQRHRRLNFVAEYQTGKAWTPHRQLGVLRVYADEADIPRRGETREYDPHRYRLARARVATNQNGLAIERGRYFVAVVIETERYFSEWV
jgi:hypothetical protein